MLQVRFKITMALLIAAICGSFADICSGQITRVEKTNEIAFSGEIMEDTEFEADGVNLGTLNLKLQPYLKFQSGEFLYGYLSLYHWRKSAGTRIQLINLRFEEQDDLIRFIRLVDELYSSPLDGVEKLELVLGGTIRGRVVRFNPLQTIQMQKDENGFFIHSPGYTVKDWRGWGADQHGYARGLFPIDLVVFRETMARAARASNLEVPEPPVEMRQAIKEIGAAIKDIGAAIE